MRMTMPGRFAITFAIAFFGVLLSGTSAQAGAVRGYIDGPVVIGDQIFPGGAVEVQAVGRGDLLAVSLDGRRVALVFRQMQGQMFISGHGHLVLRRDARGLHHLIGLQSGRSTTVVPLQVATVTKGVETIPPADLVQAEGVAGVPR